MTKLLKYEKVILLSTNRGPLPYNRSVSGKRGNAHKNESNADPPVSAILILAILAL